jgi:hypothetical protein
MNWKMLEDCCGEVIAGRSTDAHEILNLLKE